MRIGYAQVIEQLALLAHLQLFNPVVIGTTPLGLAIDTSDIDIACHATDLDHFENHIASQYSDLPGYRKQAVAIQDCESLVIQFHKRAWDIEIFCQPIPTDRQWGVRHFRIEQRLLALSPSLRPTILKLKQAGLKTEPAFAHALRLPGDPYKAILEIENLGDTELLCLARHHATSL